MGHSLPLFDLCNMVWCPNVKQGTEMLTNKCIIGVWTKDVIYACVLRIFPRMTNKRYTTFVLWNTEMIFQIYSREYVNIMNSDIVCGGLKYTYHSFQYDWDISFIAMCRNGLYHIANSMTTIMIIIFSPQKNVDIHTVITPFIVIEIYIKMLHTLSSLICLGVYYHQNKCACIMPLSKYRSWHLRPNLRKWLSKLRQSRES